MPKKAKSNLWLVVALGNPGKKYEHSRHNIGWQALAQFKLPWHEVKNFWANVAAAEMWGQKILFVEPQTFMNESGKAVAAIMNFYKISPDNLIVIHDDLDFPLGTHKIQKDRSAAGHNGVASIIEHLGTQNFQRVRLGITAASKEKFADTADYVLAPFLAAEKVVLKTTFDKIPELLHSIVTK